MKRINRMAASFLLALGMVCNSYADDVFSIYTYPPFDFNDEEFVAGKVDFTPVGTVAIWTQKEIPKSWLECNGQAVPAQFPELRKLMATVPDYRGRYARGASTDTEVGTTLEAGLPNITGHWFSNWENSSGPYWDNTSGAIRSAIWWNYNTEAMQPGGGGVQYCSFNAALSSPVYGKSTTVQPPAVIVKYIIKAE